MVISIIGAAVIGTIYSNFLVFYANFAETDAYNRAYYTAIAALERAELVVKQRQPGYEGSGGWIDNELKGPENSDNLITSNFSYLSSDNNNNSTIFRNIESLTDRIPSIGKGDVDKMLSTGDSVDYNMMEYNNSEIFSLYYDGGGTGNPYTKAITGDIVTSRPTQVYGRIRLPGYLRNTFGNLDTTQTLMGTTVKDDAVVDRQVLGNNQNDKFTVFATQRTSYNGGILADDTAIRESDINNTVNFNFTNSRNPLGGSDYWTIVGPNTSSIQSFRDIFTNSSDNQIKFSLLTDLRNRSGAVYPFLEYYIYFTGGNAKVPDKYFTITAKGGYEDYQVNLIIQKPAIKKTSLQTFTTMF